MLLGIETSTKNCSIALFKDGVQLGAHDERGDRFVHGERLHVMIQELLHKHGAFPKDLSGIIVGEGPGSYTGLRIGTSTAKGLAFALNIPMYAVPTLRCFDFSSFESNYCISVLDARRDEVLPKCGITLQEVSRPLALLKRSLSMHSLGITCAGKVLQ